MAKKLEAEMGSSVGQAASKTGFDLANGSSFIEMSGN
jgi:hypothetical protein